MKKLDTKALLWIFIVGIMFNMIMGAALVQEYAHIKANKISVDTLVAEKLYVKNHHGYLLINGPWINFYPNEGRPTSINAKDIHKYDILVDRFLE